MSNKSSADNLIIPVYINEKIVLDMLAIIEDGFSMVSQVNYSEHSLSSKHGDAETAIAVMPPKPLSELSVR